MKTMTMTEFNQKRSQALRMADEEDVIISRDGMPAYRLTKIKAKPRTLAYEIEMGRVTAPSGRHVPLAQRPRLNGLIRDELTGEDVGLGEYAIRQRERQRQPWQYGI